MQGVKTHGLDRATFNMNRRLANGAGDGTLNQGELGVVGQAVNNFRSDLAQAKSDGQVTKAEKKALRAERRSVSNLIYQMRHNQFGGGTSLPLGAGGPNGGGNRPPCGCPGPNFGGPTPAIGAPGPNFGGLTPPLGAPGPNIGGPTPFNPGPPVNTNWKGLNPQPMVIANVANIFNF